MSSSDTPEKRGNEPAYPRGASFSKLLDWHLNFGTRPNGSPDRPGERWSSVEFSQAVGTTDRAVRNWRSGRVLPINLGSVEYVLFGKNAAYKDWRFDLRAAYDSGPVGAGEIPLPPPDFLGREADITAILTVLLSSTSARAILVRRAWRRQDRPDQSHR